MSASRTLELKRLVVAALNEPSYTVGGEIYPRPAGLSVMDHPLDSVNPAQLPAMGVFPIIEEEGPQTGSGVGDREFHLQVECEARCVGIPADDAVDPLRTWAMIAIYNNEDVRAAASRDVPRTGRTTWPAPADDPSERPSVARVIQRFVLTHRTPFGNPTVKG